MGKKNRTQSRILNSFNYMFLMASVIVLVCSVWFISFHTKLQSLNAVIAIPLVILPVLFFSCFLILTFKFLKKIDEKKNQKLQIINAVLIIAISFLVTYFVQMTNQLSDGRNCVMISKELSQTMNWHNVSNFGLHYALRQCSNMVPLIYIQALVYKLFSMFGWNLSVTHMIALGTYLNTIMLLLAFMLVFKMVDRHFPKYIGTGLTFLMLINIPVFQTVYYVYTDIPAMLAIMIILNSYDHFLIINDRDKKIFWLLLIIMGSFVGALLKFNVLIATLAIVIHYVLTRSLKKSVKLTVAILIPVALLLGGTKSFMVSTSPIPKSQIGLPAINWVNMSFNDVSKNGGYDSQYFNHTFKLYDKYHTKKEVSKVEMSEFLKGISHRPSRYLYIIYRKIGATYGNGTYSFDDFFSSKYLAHPQLKHSLLGEILYGKYRKAYLYATYIIQLSFFFLMMCGFIKIIFNKINIMNKQPWIIALFGNMFLLLFWESHPRYLLAFLGPIYLVLCLAMSVISKTKRNKS